jgi:hypothetical protein
MTPMNPLAYASNTDENLLFKQVLARFDGPAYIRRGRQTELALESLLDHCRVEYETRLATVRKKVERLSRVIVTDWRLIQRLGEPFAFFGIEPEPPLGHSAPEGSSRKALAEVAKSVARFNRQWQQFLHGLDLTAVNAARAGYNRYYLLEKECAVGSLRIAKQGFTPLEPLTAGELLAKFPLLPVR